MERGDETALRDGKEEDSCILSTHRHGRHGANRDGNGERAPRLFHCARKEDKLGLSVSGFNKRTFDMGEQYDT